VTDFWNGKSLWGGGAAIQVLPPATLRATASRFLNNSVVSTVMTYIAYSSGAAVAVAGGNVEFDRCDFQDNKGKVWNLVKPIARLAA
jgi:hypothetical protein